MKKFITASLAILLLASLAIVGISASAIPGDVNGDAEVNIRDAASILLYVNGKPVECVNDVIDTNGDGTIDAKDAENILKNIAGHANADLHTGTTCSHQLKKIEAVPATGATEGSIEHWACSLCSGLFKDADAKILITKASTLTPAITPTPSEGLSFTLNPDGTAYIVTGLGSCIDSDVVIPSAYEGLPVTEIGPNAFQYSGISGIYIPGSIKTVNEGAFFGCYELKNVYFASGLETIGNYAFRNCQALESIVLPEGLKTIEEYAFASSGLKSISFPKTVESIGENVLERTDLQSITVDKDNPHYSSTGNCLIEKATRTLIVGCATTVIPSDGSVTTIGAYAFYNCNSLTSIVIPEGIKKIDENAFALCENLETVSLPASVTEIVDNPFATCISLKSFTLDKNNTVYLSSGDCLIEKATKTLVMGCQTSVIPADGSVTRIGNYAFSAQTELKSIVIPDCVTKIGEGAFIYCIGLTSINIPAGIEEIGASTFYGCTGITNIVIPNTVKKIGDCAFGAMTIKSITIPASVTEIDGNPFEECLCLENLIVEAGNTFYRAAGNCLIETATKTLISGFANSKIPDDGSVTVIGDRAFAFQSEMTSLTLPNCITKIGEWSIGSCVKLETLIFDGTEEEWNKIEKDPSWSRNSAFHYTNNIVFNVPASESLSFAMNVDNKSYSVSGIGTCTGTEIVIPSTYQGLPVTAICSSAFKNSAITKITIGSNVKTIDFWAFSGCKSLTDVTIPDSVTIIRAFAFNNCSALVNLSIGNGVENIEAEAFYGCSKLESLKLPNSLAIIDRRAFGDCSGLRSVNIPDSVTSIGSEAFSSCTALKTVTVGNSVESIGPMAFTTCAKLESINLPSSLTEIGGGAFYGCSNLTSITIPEKITVIPDTTFAYCSSLRTVFIGSGVTAINDNAFRSCGMLLSITFDGTKEDWEKVTKGQNWNYGCPFAEVVFTKIKTSEGFTFALNDDGKSYTLRRIGTCTDTELVLPSEYNGLPVTAIASWAFSENDSIVSVIIPASVTEIGSGAFYHCSSLKKVVLSKNVKVLNNILSYCESLTEIELPEGITELNNTFNFSPIKSVNFPSTLTKIEGAFFATALEKVEIPASVTVIGKSSFQCCNELTEVIIKGKTSIGEEAFDNCPKLSKVTMNAVTSIGAYAFSECASLERIVLPDSVTSLGENIFDECPALVDCFFDGNANQWFAVDRNETWFNPQTVEGYYIHGGRMWEDTNVILLKPEYSFTLNENNSSYTWNGSGGFRNIVISSAYNGLPVTNFKLVDPYGQSIRKVYFEGTPAEWDAITMSGDTYIIERAVVYFYSFKEPTTCGNFWHFVDGLPVAWNDDGREHTVVTTPAVPATCTENGLTEGKTCSVCGFVIAYQNTVYSKGHQKVSENGKAATARTFGYTKYEYCTVCLTVTSERELILPTGISDPANYTGKYGYEYLATLEKGEAMQQFYKSLDREAAKFHLNGETLNNQYNTLPFISYTDLGLSYDEAISVYTIYKNDHPLYYWISNTWYYSGGKLAMSVVPEYVDGETRTKTNEFVYAALAEYLKVVMNETSDYQIAFGLHDAIVLNASYAYESNGKTPEDADWAHSIIGILDRNLGVCESYAELFHTLLNFAGVDSILVHGLGNGGAHAWNLVRLDDGEWYWYDPTWAETTWEYYGVNHTAFCLTDTQDPTVDIAGWEFSRSPFAESHVPYSSENYGRYYCYALPERSETAFDTDDTQLYDTFIYEGTKYIVIGYGRVFCSEIWGINSTPPETLTYNGREYKVSVYEY